MLTKCQGYLIFNWETLILVNVLKDQELAVPTSAFISTDMLETVYEKKSDVICSSSPPRCALPNVGLRPTIKCFCSYNTTDMYLYMLYILTYSMLKIN